jgi:hypothetical protein
MKMLINIIGLLSKYTDQKRLYKNHPHNALTNMVSFTECDGGETKSGRTSPKSERFKT